MKFFSKILLVVAVALASVVPAKAQLDFFGDPRTLIVTSNQVLTATRSNDVVDLHGWVGTVKLDLGSSTNSQTNQVQVQLYGSNDRTNFTTITYALGVTYQTIITNLYYGSGTPLATNNYILAGTVTTPTAATAGFATKYISQAPFTNTGAITFVGNTTVGFEIADAPRYLQLVWTISSQTNGVSAVLTGRKQQQ